MAKYDILLIGDGTRLLQTIGWVLEYKGFVVKATTSPEAALEALVKRNYDLVIAKLDADDLDGLDILKRAKRLNPEVKVVVVSGNSGMIFPMEAYQVEVDDYILMPVSPTELWRRVSQCLEGREVVDLQPVRVPLQKSGNSDKARPQFMLMVHDIRSSMISAAAAVRLMSRGAEGEMSDASRAKLREVSARIDNMIHLTEDFLGKVIEGHNSGGKDILDLENDIVEPVLAELAPEIRDRGINLENRLPQRLDDKIFVKGSKMWLKSVFRNLVHNGIKYGGRGCTIVIGVERHGTNCRLQVYNTGKSVPEDQRSILFSSTPTLRRVKRGRQGLGLGLSLSRDIIQNQGGDIWYEARNDGSNFVMSLPQG